MARLRTVQEFLALEGDEAPTPAERALVEACRAGEECVLGDGELPATDSRRRRVRADLLRLLVLGGTKDCGLHESGIVLIGGWITGALDLRFVTGRGQLVLGACFFANTPHLEQARFEMLSLSRSHLPGIHARGLTVTGSVLLRETTSDGMIDLNAARISDQLMCDQATLNGFGKSALHAQGVRVGQALLLRSAKTTGMIDVNGAIIEGIFDCSGTSFDGAGDPALFGQSMQISKGLVFQQVETCIGSISLTSAHVGELVDDMTSWEKISEKLILEGFTYDRIVSKTLDIGTRLRWLEKGARYGGVFTPQPYTQFANVMRDMGHSRAARRVLAERERLLGKEQFHDDKARLAQLRSGGAQDDQSQAQQVKGDIGKQWIRTWSSRLWNKAIGGLVGYGYLPERALIWAAGAMLVSTVLYFIAYRSGAIVPDSAVVLTSADWLAAMKSDAVRTTLVWQNTPSATHYETFNAGAFAADVFLPIIELGQDAAWAATTTTTFGCVIWAYTWALQLFGWLVSAFGVAAITGIMQRDRA